MILSGTTIQKLKLVDPIEPRTKHKGMSYGLSYAGYDIRLAEGVTIIPGRTSLGISFERFAMPNNVLGEVKDKSSWARLGLSVKNTVIEPGWAGYLTLEISYDPVIDPDDNRTVLGSPPLYIEEGMPIAQVLFYYVDLMTSGYDGKYQNADQFAQPAIFEGVK